MSEKNKQIKIRRTWTRHPAERIKEDKEHKDHCELCGLYLRDPEACIWCSFDETEQVGGTSGN